MGKRIFLIAGLAMALVSATYAQVESLARGDHSPTEQAAFTKAVDHADLFVPVTMQVEELFVITQPVKYVEAKAEPIEKFAGVATLVELRSWRAITQRNYGAYDAGYKTTVVNLPDEPYNTARWKDLHRRSC